MPRCDARESECDVEKGAEWSFEGLSRCMEVKSRTLRVDRKPDRERLGTQGYESAGQLKSKTAHAHAHSVTLLRPSHLELQPVEISDPELFLGLPYSTRPARAPLWQVIFYLSSQVWMIRPSLNAEASCWDGPSA